MKVVGLITEYNPFHNGHLYHLQRAKEAAQADYCIVAMSGSFVQRGAPAIYDKYTRTSMALKAGADLVLEIPAAFSTASAREFAAYAISLLDKLGVVDTVCFGSECGDISLLHKLAVILSREPEEYSSLLKNELRKGFPFPQARTTALFSYLKSSPDLTAEPADLALALKSPNNILGVEYCRALQKLSSPMTPCTIVRTGGYHDLSLDSPFVSASALRAAILDGQPLSSMEPLVPGYVLEQIKSETPVALNDLTSILNYKILDCLERGETLTEYADMTKELSSRLVRERLQFDTFSNKAMALKSRQITYARVSRALIHLILNIKSCQVDSFKQKGYALYARVLGFRREAAPLLKEIKEKGRIPLVTKLADTKTFLEQDAMVMLEQEIAASHLYQMVRHEKGGDIKNEYTTPISIL